MNVSSSGLNDVITRLHDITLKEEAYFGIYEIDEIHENHVIRANEHGLLRYALELLEIAADLNKDQTKRTLLGVEDHWTEGDVFIEYVEHSERKLLNPVPLSSKFQDSLFAFGCVAVLIVLSISMVTGLFVILRSIFGYA